MDLIFNKKINEENLKDFFENEWPAKPCNLVSNGLEKGQFNKEKPLYIELIEISEYTGDYKYGIIIGFKHTDYEKFLEYTAFRLSKKFKMGVLYGISEFEGKYNPYYSILFENNEAYLVDDSDVDRNGNVKMIKKIKRDSVVVGLA